MTVPRFKQEDWNTRDEVFGNSTTSKTSDRENADRQRREIEALSPEERAREKERLEREHGPIGEI